MTDTITLHDIKTSPDKDFENIYNINNSDDNDINAISPYDICPTNCNYYEPDKFQTISRDYADGLSIFHLNCQGLGSHWDNFKSLLTDINKHPFMFDLIGISESFRTDIYNLDIQSHTFISRTRNISSKGGVGIYINKTLNYHIRDDLSTFIPHIYESVVIEVELNHDKNLIVAVIYRPNTAPKADFNIFTSTFIELIELINNEKKAWPDCRRF